MGLKKKDKIGQEYSVGSLKSISVKLRKMSQTGGNPALQKPLKYKMHYNFNVCMLKKYVHVQTNTYK